MDWSFHLVVLRLSFSLPSFWLSNTACPAFRANPRTIPDLVRTAPGQSIAAALLRTFQSPGVKRTEIVSLLFSWLTPYVALAAFDKQGNC
jgi:hypothetical protein